MVSDDGLNLAANGNFFDGQVDAQRDADPTDQARVAMVKAVPPADMVCPMKNGTTDTTTP
jgi:hypothetical protein